ncbi:sigma-54 dependent transcriptional regulator [Geobacter sp. DSM 9736]|uniref:sigma-54-dependent transcriptional regulator n=1 Tax=Geobacter sp. DSM 9736 TaxID=1277350 RepID=UPI000B502B2A|nr:sigma-54 dependent transcriptional regulator [Geobacter sp. DSM 9736]SNB44957.1 DNA-binding transcriptional response regulator, NtrC family, contains REC, AAA-type ATPase, and a Fis-type DNA-binding domains [Geobacter sp. DSM 9736]
MSADVKPVLLVDDEPNILTSSRLALRSQGVDAVATLSDSREVLPFLEANSVSAIVMDLFMPNLSGLELLPVVVERFPHIPVIVMTAVGEAQTAVDCMKMGACDYLVKPVDPGQLYSSVRKALEIQSLSNELSSLKECLFDDSLRNPEAFAAIVTRSDKMHKVFQYVEVVANSRQPLLVTGETGVGKELFARAIHTLSGRRGEFVSVNVAGLDDNMFSDALFGHKRGAFTGADQPREGFIARAAGGTLFLDEIGDMKELSQIKLLRLLQENEYYPVGSDVPRKSEARIVCATNRNLQQAISAGEFRNDLYYRLCAHQVRIPPLRERREDIPFLLDHFLAEAAMSFNKRKPTPPPELVTLLSLHPFPGNVRELQALVFDAVARHASGVLSMESFRSALGDERPLTAATPSEEDPLYNLFGHFPTMREMEDHLIREAMKRANGNQGIAASLLGTTRQTLNRRLQSKEES